MTGIAAERDGAVLTLAIRRPERRNALDNAAYASLAAQLRQAAADPALAAVILTGSDGQFTAGNDLRDFQAERPPGDSPALGFLRALVDLDVPVLAAVEGHAVGIGVTLLQHCDFVYAASDARLRMPFVNLGLCPEGGSSLMLPRLAGARRAAEWLLLGRAIDPQAACEAGLVSALTPPGGALDAARATAAELAALPPAALRASKALLRRAERAEIHAALDAEAEQFRLRLRSPEAQQAFARFLHKRDPA
ncbi:enoyl-CoA hydratase-related protein [Bordetella sp. 2513F-2]